MCKVYLRIRGFDDAKEDIVLAIMQPKASLLMLFTILGIGNEL